MTGIETLFVILFGLTFGSFITLASYRLPREDGIIFGASRCPVCTTDLGFKDLWPVLSWVIHKGRCSHCSSKISVRYPLIELITAGVFVLIYFTYGFTLQAVLLALMAVALLIMIVADLEHYIIPDEIHLFLLPLGILYHFVMETPWSEPLFGTIAGLTLGAALHYGYFWLRGRHGLGFGDVKFLSAAGLWVGISALPYFLFYSGALGVLIGIVWRITGRGEHSPFGPALALSLFVCMTYSPATEFLNYLNPYAMMP